MTLKSDAAQFIYKIIADEATMAILLIGPNGSIKYANRMAQDLFEFEEPSAAAGEQDGLAPLPVSVNELFVDVTRENRIKCFGADTLEMQGIIQEIMIKKFSARTFIASCGIKHIDVENERHILLMIQDVTFQKKLQREISEKQSAIQQAFQDLLKQNQQLKELDATKDKFVAMTTHELRTPTSAILASAEVLKDKLYDTPEQHDEFVNMIYEQGTHLLDLVNDILDFAKIQANKMDYFVEERDLVEIVAQQVESMIPMANAAHIQLELTKPEAPMVCYFDDVRVKQIIDNLISNAIKYNSPNGRVNVAIKSSDDAITVHVRDTGPGIPEEAFEKIFSEFETLGKIGNHSKGTGLGLPISRRMTRRMGGEIYLKSTVGQGSEFWFSVPRNRVLEEADYRSRSISPDDLAA